MLDERLSLAAALFEPCDTGADIGTDHGLLPCQLLLNNRCRFMLLSDISAKALRHAEDTLRRHGLKARAKLFVADGLTEAHRACGCVSVTGMGGRTMAELLRRGQRFLRDDCRLVLSAQTDHALVREALMDTGWHLTQERLCRSGGRFYLLWQAARGGQPMSRGELRRGSLLFQQPQALLPDYLDWRIDVIGKKSASLSAQAELTPAQQTELSESTEDLEFYREARRRC